MTNDDDVLTTEWLEDNGFKPNYDGEEWWSYTLLLVQSLKICVICKMSSENEILKSTLNLWWKCPNSICPYNMHITLRDGPTKDDILRLIKELKGV